MLTSAVIPFLLVTQPLLVVEESMQDPIAMCISVGKPLLLVTQLVLVEEFMQSLIAM